MPTSYFDREIELYRKVIDIIDNKISKGKDLKSVKKDLYKKIERLEYLKNYD
tara:strand:+ start:609 stop:764 length:156 start_codon:yes stop_codon:yes gene_type:complete